MRISQAIVAISAALLSVATGSAEGPCVRTTDQLVQDWSQSKELTLDVANAMPAEFYGFKPVPAEMSFAEQMMHIGFSNAYYFSLVSHTKPPFNLDTNMKVLDKPGVIRMLQQSFDYVIGLLPNITQEQLEHRWDIEAMKGRPHVFGRDMIMNMYMHTAHHRAQCEVYLRLKNIKPPTYAF